jgi:hypothetical protein
MDNQFAHHILNALKDINTSLQQLTKAVQALSVAKAASGKR